MHEDIDWQKIQDLRVASYARHPTRYSRGVGSLTKTGISLGVFSEEGQAIASMRLHATDDPEVPLPYREPARETCALLGIPRAYVLDRFVAATDVADVELAAYAICTALLLVVKQDRSEVPIRWALGLAQKPLARRYTRVYGFKFVSETEWYLPELSSEKYRVVGNDLRGVLSHKATHPTLREMLLTESHPAVEFYAELRKKPPLL